MTARTSWADIAEREEAEDYPAAIAALEHLLEEDPENTEAVVRLGFNYWLAIAETDRLRLQVPVKQYAKRFAELLEQYEASLGAQADFCWAFGLPLMLHYYYFGDDGTDASELNNLRSIGERLLHRAAGLDRFYPTLRDGAATQEELARRFRGRGSLARYYGVV